MDTGAEVTRLHASNNAKPRRRWGGLALLACAAAVGGWFAMGAMLETSVGDRVERSTPVTLYTDPLGVRVWADGFELGPSPQVAWAAPGAAMTLGAGDDRDQIVHRVRGDSADRVLLRAVRRGEARRADPGRAGQPASNRTAGDVNLPGPIASVAEQRRDLASSRGRSQASSAAVESGGAVPPHPSKRPRPATTHRPVSRARIVRSSKSNGGWGHLSVVVSPWARVFVDGHDLSHTPLKMHRLRVGRHRVELRNSELQKREVVWVRVPLDGGTVVLRRTWD